MTIESNNVPKILERDDIIILDENIICNCGRTKKRAHCPKCGSVQTYGQSARTIAKIPATGDIVKGCKAYRCIPCGEKFDDVDWYFNCHADIKVDWTATKKRNAEHAKQVALGEWQARIKYKMSIGEPLSANDKTSCYYQTGLYAAQIVDLLKKQEEFEKGKRESLPETNLDNNEEIKILTDRITEQQEKLKHAITQDEQDSILSTINFFKEKIKEFKKEKGG